jgi:PmbA protein
MDYKILAEQLVKKCLDKGINAAEVFIQTGRNLSIEVRNGEVETVKEAASHGAGFRVFQNGRLAFSHCNDFSESSLENAVQSAVRFAGNTTPGGKCRYEGPEDHKKCRSCIQRGRGGNISGKLKRAFKKL